MEFLSKAGDAVKGFLGEAEGALDTASVAFSSDADLLDSDAKARMDPPALRKAVAVVARIREKEDKTGCTQFNTEQVKAIAAGLVRKKNF